MTEISEKVKTRGHWIVRVRPESYDVERSISSADLEKAVRESAVSLRGWDFPHFDYQRPCTRTQKYVEQGIDWEHFVEMWRAYKSGQFVAINALWDDWRDKSSFWPRQEGWQTGTSLGVEDAVYRLVEIYEFAARWTQALGIGDAIVLECAIRGLTNRRLVLSPNRGFRIGGTCEVPEWTYEATHSPSSLLAQARELAVAPAISLFEIFGWDARPAVIKDIQNEIGR
jgi:hypothetical protein